MTKGILQLDGKVPILSLVTFGIVGLTFCLTTNAKVDNMKEEIISLKTQQSVMQTTLDSRGQYGVLSSDRITRVEVKVEGLEKAIVNINDNVQKIADRILDEKTHR